MLSPSSRHPSHLGEAGSNERGLRQRPRGMFEGVSPIRLLPFGDYDDVDELRAAERLHAAERNDKTQAPKSRAKNTCTVLVRHCPGLPWKQALLLAKGWSGLSWISKGSKTGQADYSCATHRNCEALLRVKADGADGANIFSNAAPHSDVFSAVPHTGRGVGGEFKEEIRTLNFAGHFGAMGIFLKLQLKYGAALLTRDLAKHARIPTVEEIRSFLSNNCSASSLLFSNAELLAFASDKEVDSFDAVQERGPQDPGALPLRRIPNRSASRPRAPRRRPRAY
ncbi:hypothetical protein M885DRAFT_608436 [Pelagophyceae sp. CCMP2097]|nr:hypothetical protein M885DRAFT_608436 [Pelagophyceae sp. CCMP2097]